MAADESTTYPPFAVTVDLVVLTVRAQRLQAVVIRRGEAPFLGGLALPGGFVRPDEDLAGAARRELAEEAGIELASAHLEQLASYGAPDRDPRMRVVTVAYLVLAPGLPAPRPGGDAVAARWQPVAPLLARPDRLAFDHVQILRDGLERARSKLEYTTLAATFCPSEFTVAELREVYQTVWDRPVDPRNFHRKVTSAPDFLVPVGATTTRGGGRPAELYQRGAAVELYPPLLRGTGYR